MPKSAVTYFKELRLAILNLTIYLVSCFFHRMKYHFT